MPHKSITGVSKGNAVVSVTVSSSSSLSERILTKNFSRRHRENGGDGERRKRGRLLLQSQWW